MTTASETLAEWGIGLALSEVPKRTIEVTREHILDTLGCGLAAHAAGEGTAARQVAISDNQHGRASLLGADMTVPAPIAALANGMLCHSLDFDDTHEASIAHIGTVVIPAAIAAAQAADRDGDALLAAVIVGTEAVARIGMAASEGFHARGFHPTGVCGIFGATLAACRLRGADIDCTTRALGLAGSMGSGIFEYLSDGSPTKPLHAGWAAHSGLMAAEIAAAGGAGPRTVFEGRFGLYETHVDTGHDIWAALRDLGDRWEVDRVALKPYPACHWIHSSVDAAVQAADGAEPDQIERIVVRIPRSGVPIVLEPPESKWRPTTRYDAKFALPWCVSERIVHGKRDVRTFLERDIADPVVLDFASRIEPGSWTGPPATSPFAGIAEVTVAGSTRTARLESPRGSAANPLRREEVHDKFRANASLALGETQVQAVIDAVDGLCGGTPLHELASSLHCDADVAAAGLIDSSRRAAEAFRPARSA
jgi:2-methylcitrate dehydratase PrpD